MAGGDTLIIGPGSYRMGQGAPGSEECSSDYPWDCHMPPVPSGPDAEHPTRILGAGGGAARPELWGAERAFTILNLEGSTNVEIGGLELTDHLGCVEFHTGGIPCPREEYPYGDWCPRGIYAVDSRRVYIHDLDIHGLAYAGIQAGRLADWRVENVRLAGNGWAGWDGDVEGEDANSGEMRFLGLVVEWNGCGEAYPGGHPTGCWAQTAGGYGDGLGTGETGGEWIFEDSVFRNNTSDGLDLLYAVRTGATITIRRTWAGGNAGNQIKTAGPARIENCIVAGNCGFFEGKGFTYFVDSCRALGNALSLSLRPGDEALIVNCTITGEGDCLILAECLGPSCDGTERVTLRNNILLGQVDYLQPLEKTCLTYGGGFPGDPFDRDYSVIWGVKEEPCPAAAHDCCEDPRLAGMTLEAFDAMLMADSPAIDAGLAACGLTMDYAGNPRPSGALPDIGAYEYPSGWDAGCTAIGGGWRRLGWFGDYVPMGDWIFHNKHGFWYPAPGSTPQNIWFYTQDMGWLYTSNPLYSFLYRSSPAAWLWYNEATNPRWFWNMTTGTWESRP